MSTKLPESIQINFYIPVDLRHALDVIRERDGIPLSEQMRRAVRLWVEQKFTPPVPPKGKR